MSMRVSYRSLVVSLALAIVLPPLTTACRRAEQQASGTVQANATNPPATASGDADAPAAAPANVNTVIPLETSKVVGRTALGSVAGADGMVQNNQDQFKRGEPIRVSIWLEESPAGLQTRAEWQDDKEKVLHEESRAMNGGKQVTFEYKGKRLAPGKYKVVAYWGGNLIAEHDFTVVK